MSKQVGIDWKTFIKFWLVPLIILVVLYFLNKAQTGLIVIGISIFLALALRPLVKAVDNFFTKHFGSDKQHETLSVVLAYLIVVLVLGAIVAIVGPVVVNETAKFISNFPETFEKTFGGWEGINNFGRSIGIENLQSELSNFVNGISNGMLGFLSNNIMSSVSGVANVLMEIALVIVLTLLFLLEGPKMLDNVWESLGSDKKNSKKVSLARRILGKMADVVSTYISRQMVVAFIDGCASATIVFILSLVMGLSLELALPMGMITMVFYMIPMFGQFIGGTLVTALLFFSNPLAALIFAVVYIVYAQIENNVIAPKIQGSALNLQPVIILCAITAGMYAFGLLGAIIAVPIAGCIRVLMDEYRNIEAVRD